MVHIRFPLSPRDRSMMENHEVLASCEVEFAGPAPGPRIDWHFGNTTDKGPVGAPKKRYGGCEKITDMAFVYILMTLD